MSEYKYLELSEKIHDEQRVVIKKLIDEINNLDIDNIRYKDIIHIKSKINQASNELEGLNKFWHVLCYLDGEWTDEERIERAKHMA